MYPRPNPEKLDPKRIAIAGPMPMPKSTRPPRHQRGELFLRGPIPMAWLAQAAKLPGQSLFVGITLWHLVGVQKRRVVKWQPKRASQFGLQRRAVYRALDALESAGLVSIERRRGRAPTITLHNAHKPP